ncbi:hypothetical protein [Nocardia sp. CY41]|uniref:hypothetical protein n=1 Tax=Nocardia sp. CY41 TaxID=2608686 RepID=UPI00135CD9BA|nr:hypothetical protein [Nocardia sp. CY41]
MKELTDLGWGTVLDEAAADEEAFALLVRGKPRAVLMSLGSWRLGREAVDVPASAIERVTSHDVRQNLASSRDAARSGRHILITRYAGIRHDAGTDDPTEDPTVAAVLAPYDWTTKALSLGDIVTTGNT